MFDGTTYHYRKDRWSVGRVRGRHGGEKFLLFRRVKTIYTDGAGCARNTTDNNYWRNPHRTNDYSSDAEPLTTNYHVLLLLRCITESRQFLAEDERPRVPAENQELGKG